MSADARDTALAEMTLCQTVLAKGGLNVVTETLGTGQPTTWTHYPQEEVYDPHSGAQWFYHSHAIGDGSPEHGHFHCFVRPDGPEGPVHHLAAVGVDGHGRLVRLFTVNQWVVGDDWLDADPTIALLARFDVHMPRPSYLVNRWLTAVFVAYGDEIAELIRDRDARLASHRSPGGTPVREDRDLEVTADYRIP